MNEWVNKCEGEWVNEWVSEWTRRRMSEWINEWINEWQSTYTHHNNNKDYSLQYHNLLLETYSDPLHLSLILLPILFVTILQILSPFLPRSLYSLVWAYTEGKGKSVNSINQLYTYLLPSRTQVVISLFLYKTLFLMNFLSYQQSHRYSPKHWVFHYFPK